MKCKYYSEKRWKIVKKHVTERLNTTDKHVTVIYAMFDLLIAPQIVNVLFVAAFLSCEKI